MVFDKTGHEYGVTCSELENVENADCMVVAAIHNVFRLLPLQQINTMFYSKRFNNN